MCDLSVIVVSWNTRELLRDCLAAVPAGCGDLSHEILVADNASADGSADMVRDEFPAVRLIETGANLGFARANNRALAEARGRHLLLLNPDTVCEPGALAALSAFLDDTPGAGACGPTLVDADGRPTLSWGEAPRPSHHLLSIVDPGRRWLPADLRERAAARPPRPGDAPRRVDYVVGACLMATRTAWEAVGPLDERFFMYFEETDWCRRAAAAGHETWLVPAARVAHLEGRAAARVSDFALAQFQHSYRLYAAKHHGAGRVRLLRVLQFAEYGLKWALRRAAGLLQPGRRERHAALAENFRRIAALQLRDEIAPRPPA